MFGKINSKVSPMIKNAEQKTFDENTTHKIHNGMHKSNTERYLRPMKGNGDQSRRAGSAICWAFAALSFP